MRPRPRIDVYQGLCGLAPYKNKRKVLNRDLSVRLLDICIISAAVVPLKVWVRLIRFAADAIP